MKASGILYAFGAVTIFSIQDAISRHLGPLYSPFFISMIRYWAFGLFAFYIVSRSKIGILGAIRTEHLGLQIWRSLLLVAQILISILSFAYVGLAKSQAVFAAAPLVVALLSVPLLGEKVGWRRWLAIAVGLCGVLVIINPLGADFTSTTLIAVVCCITFSLYSIYTRMAGRYDSAEVSFFYTGLVGLIVTSIIGPFFWESVRPIDWFWLIALCFTGISSHYLMIKALALTEAVTVQTVTYLQLVYASIYGVLIFSEKLTVHMMAGSVIVVIAGGFTIWREHQVKRRERLAAG
ncbi:DMT family transporter [Martelella sp. HB161492]|uniref:DMT family transporter n=1 Tax=Martelella sp. HB161492 TaxID=2720726 RepID=UPI001591B24F|nr:DMT family transporter [Martelella sp. HB161492]